jgi:AcrR family transcriptional regulator
MQPGTTKRQGELLDGLVELFLARGFQGFTMGDLADEMHCSKSTLYALGHSKEALVRNVLVHFFRSATEGIAGRVDGVKDPAERLVGYLQAVADELRPASPAFFADLGMNPDALKVYERNTQIAAERISEMISEGAAEGAFRKVESAFVADLVAAEMRRIQTGVVRERTDLSDAEAYDALASLVLNGISS